jgi:putative ABC transport system substrate-binding protein
MKPRNSLAARQRNRGTVTVGLDYYNVGRQTGNIVVRILRGEKPGKIPVTVADKTNLYVNPTIAKKMGLTIPEDVVSQADEVVK